jgi:hypothetical protein
MARIDALPVKYRARPFSCAEDLLASPSLEARGNNLERVDIHRVQICAPTIDSMDMNALGVCL